MGLCGRGIRPAFRDGLVDIFLCNVAKGVGRVVEREKLFALQFGEGIDALSKFCPRLVALAAGFCKIRLRLAAEGNAVVLVQVVVLPAPQFRAAGSHLGIRSAFVRALVA